MKSEIFVFKENKNINFNFVDKEVVGEVTVYSYNFEWNKEASDSDETIEFSWAVPQNDLLYTWTQNSVLDHFLPTNYSAYKYSMISYNSPCMVLFNGKSEHKYSWALDECSKLVYYKSGVNEWDASVDTYIRIPLKQFANQYSTTLKIRIDTETKSFSKGLRDISKWWESTLKQPPLAVPDLAKEPLFSFWYSYHRCFNAQMVEKACEDAAKLGFKVMILDDGWQTNNMGWEGYEICGDWQVGAEKIPDMKKHIENVHKLGMKYILWFSVPFMGAKTKAFSKFENMILRYFAKNVGLLDPRYKEVREYLISIYKKAVLEWGVDGLKLDFIDRWREEPDNADYNDKMDIYALQDAVDRLMSDIVTELKKINPDILIEFRQGYIGPNMRRFGNMFRVTDCPDDYIKNRVGVLDLRQMMGESAVHSDMLMWHNDETPELVAVQIISILFGVMQYSVKIEEQSEDVMKVSKFWLDFMNEHRDLLLNSSLTAYEPHLLYTWAKTSSDDECAIAVYSIDKCVKPDLKDTVYIANGCEDERIFVELEDNYSADVYNCMGEKVLSDFKLSKGVNTLNIPVGGMAKLLMQK
ncbi:MAG: alpha-galactosidase [Ruminococcaceae bacterium]|nr:alpha-galactosidase [Oscillospiraceae bacterium]